MFEEADEAITRQASGNETAMDFKLAVHFYPGVELDRLASELAKRNIFKDVPWVKIYVPGDKNTVVDRIAWLDERHPMSDVSRFPKHWERFQKQADQSALDGMPLTEWPQITKSQVIELAYHGVKSVEQLAGISDVNLQKLGAGALALNAAAKQYLVRAQADAGKANLQSELKVRDDKNAALQAQVEALQAQVAKVLEAQGFKPTGTGAGKEDGPTLVTPSQEPKRVRGRQPKVLTGTPHP